ncbi:hypothetical protein FOXG_10175 [Fusarium oxysporum f. sp. lycopersici 4287]|uniref:C2H2-type domain-containing protein n=1 Tax=Fusarium oxysporum f. sp. lycopersici (strain 4287 / CBS 123668 / FGSC 9935 / NRRL 34936) TaxID=426428 RepID=A0A0J9VFF2_FUSO4|nr:hypothetical protein FOXG_10175 [Fusarium oxysporum f. sp. lycopersici 4287]KAJ9416676.1 hypothetical protein QL093DRAFT_2445039 [Fusarium oxysporum]KNB09636.1 hypothetical protein FOXG_10175 [Fusarium oxysporum f. sp. lycopersici 4287]
MSLSLTGEAGDHSPNATVSECAQRCFESFQHCLNSASRSDKLRTPRSQLSLVRVEDQLARFQLWTTNIRVFSTGRDSLDYRLRDVPDVQTPVIGLLQALDFQIKTCSRILDSILLTPERTKIEEGLEKFVDSLDGVSSEITLLHKITNTIRRASKDTQNSRAAEGFKIRDDEGNDAGPFLQEIFANYIHDRFPGASEDIRKRLASSMVIRRKRLLYRRERYGKKPIQLPQITSAPRISHPEPDIITPLDDAERPAKRRIVAAPAQSVVHSTATATTLSPERFRKAAAPSVVSVSKTVKLSDNDDAVFPPAPTRALMQRYNNTKRDIEDRYKQRLSTIHGYHEGVELTDLVSGDAREILDAELVRDSALAKAWDDCIEAVGEVTCPYCFHVLPIREVIDDLKWKYHVKNDLEPYVCLFEACHTSGHLYTHSNTWIRHMSEHALRWRCASRRHGEFLTDSREHYLDHMKNSHSGVFTDAQLGVLADQNGRTIGPLFKACPLCGEEKGKSSLIDHLVGHMRSLALKSLPSHHQDTNELGEIGVEQDSWGSSLPHSRSTIKNASKVDLEFSDTSGPGQPHINIPVFKDIGMESVEVDEGVPLTMPRFACPFFKHNPKRYENKIACRYPGWETVHRLKEHIFRSHMLPKYECRRCFQFFETAEGLGRHSEKIPVCEVSTHRPEENEGIDERQAKALRKRTKNSNPKADPQTVQKQIWNDIYMIIFPQENQIPTPYFTMSEIKRW